MAENESGERTEEPTQQRREDFRKRGQVVQSREISSLLILLSGLICMGILGKFFFSRASNLFRSFFSFSIKEGSWQNDFILMFQETAFILLPILFVFWTISFLSSFSQVGFLVNEEALQLKWERLDPVAGMKRILSLRSFVEGIKAFLKLFFISFVIFIIAKSEVGNLPYLVYSNMGQIFQYFSGITLKILTGVSVLMLILGGLDYLFQKWDLEQKMKMTKQEVKEELKAREGDPLIKARIRRVQKERLNQKMLSEVPLSDVVVTNPTHISVALKYTEQMMAPMVVAKGTGWLAEKIKSLAKDHEVPLVENKPLARIMYRTLKIGQVIPKELYSAVAEILSYVYKLKRKSVHKK